MHRALLGCLLAAAALLRVTLTCVYAGVADPHLWEFGDIAENLLATGTYSYASPGVPTAYMPPGYPLLIYTLYALFGVNVTAHAVLAAVLLLVELAIPFLIWWVARQIWGRTAGAVAFLLALFWPSLLLMSGRLSDVPVYAALLMLACGLMFSTRWSVMTRAALCGGILGLYANFRFEGVLFLVPCAWYLARGTSPTRSLRGAVKPIALMAACCALLIFPWLLRNYRVFDGIVVGTSSGYNLRKGFHEHATGTPRDPWPAARKDLTAARSKGGTTIPGEEDIRNRHPIRTPSDELVVDRLLRDAAVRFIADHPGDAAVLLPRKAFYFLVADFTHPVGRLWPVWLPSLVALIIGGAFWARTGVRDARQNSLWTVFGMQLGMVMVVFVVPRHRMAVDFIPLLFFAAWTAEAVVPRVRAAWRRIRSEQEARSDSHSMV